MGRKGLFSSAAAGGSLIAASLLVVVAVSTMIGVRGFDGAREVPAQQSVVLRGAAAEEREPGTTAPKPRPVVIGGRSGKQPDARRKRARATARAARRRRTARRRTGSTERVRAAARADSGASYTARRNRPAPSTTTKPSAPAPAVTTDALEEKVPATPVGQVVDGVAGAVEGVAQKPVETVGDVLLDLRDALP